jgi:hypothetical protein
MKLQWSVLIAVLARTLQVDVLVFERQPDLLAHN